MTQMGGSKKRKKKEIPNICGTCKKEVGQSSKALLCDMCSSWYHAHKRCGGMEMEKAYTAISDLENNQQVKWLCKQCEKEMVEILQNGKKIMTEARNMEKLLQEKEDKECQLKNEIKTKKRELEQRQEEIDGREKQIRNMIEELQKATGKKNQVKGEESSEELMKKFGELSKLRQKGTRREKEEGKGNERRSEKVS